MSAEEPTFDGPNRISHGSSSSFMVSGIVVAILINAILAAGILIASEMKAEALTAQTSEEVTVFQCRYVENGRFVQLEVPADSWAEAEAATCGVEFTDVRVPPLLAGAYGRLIHNPDLDPILMAQRESCSCSDGELPPIIEDVTLVEPPKLGTAKKEKALVRIVNNPEEIEHNAINPDQEPVAEPKDEKKKDRKKSHKPDLDELLRYSDQFDEARPSNQDEQVGEAWGSKHGKGAGKGDVYIQKIIAKLENNLQAPSAIPRSELKQLKGRVWIKIGDNGKVWGWGFKRKSKNNAFDTMIERTMKRFEIGGDLSFPSPPANWKLKAIGVKVDGSKVK